MNKEHRVVTVCQNGVSEKQVKASNKFVWLIGIWTMSAVKTVAAYVFPAAMLREDCEM